MRGCPARSASDRHDYFVGLTKQGEEYQGGQILDPENGKTYRARMKLIDNGQKLDVRGFIGFSLFGRSQIWIRAE
jgi:uncharacterized protein (DUF2147 family)